MNIFNKRKRAFLGVASFLYCIIILFAGLWPYSFTIKNDVKWLADKNGVNFHGRGIVYSHEQITIPAHSHQDNNSITIELRLQSKVKPERHMDHFHKATWHYSEILSFFNNNMSEEFTIGQWKSNLLIRSILHNNKMNRYKDYKDYKEIGIRNVLKYNEIQLITITSDEKITSVYVNGKLEKSFPWFSLIPINKVISGRLLLGNSSSGKNPWKGNLFGLTIYNRSFTGEEALQNYISITQQVSKPSLTKKGLLANYLFDEHVGTAAKNSLHEQYSLSIPEIFKRFAKKEFLLSPWINYKRNGLNINDIIVNVIGFIPFGFLFSAFLFNQKNFSLYGGYLIIFLLGCGISLIIELLQFHLPTRTSSLTDLICNIFGTMLGIAAFQLAHYIKTEKSINISL